MAEERRASCGLARDTTHLADISISSCGGPSIKVNMHACAHDTTIQIHLAVFDKSNFIRKCIETCTSTKTEITTMTYAMFTTFLSK